MVFVILPTLINYSFLLFFKIMLEWNSIGTYENLIFFIVFFLHFLRIVFYVCGYVGSDVKLGPAFASVLKLFLLFLLTLIYYSFLLIFFYDLFA